MLENNEKFGAFIIPTGIAASIGGFAGDASPYAKLFSKVSKLIVNPNVVNAGCFSGISKNMLYLEGFSLDSFFKQQVSLRESFNNKIGVIFDKSIPHDVLNVHINTINAVKTVYGVDIPYYEITSSNVGVDFFVNEYGISTGRVNNVETLKDSGKKLLNKGCNALAICCLFDDIDDENYAQNGGVDPIGGVEAIISHYISKELKVPCAHSPAFINYQINSEIVDDRASSEYITPTFLPCILLGLNNAPQIIEYNQDEDLSIDNLDYIVVPYNALGSIPVLEAMKRDIKILSVLENKTVLNMTNNILFNSDKILPFNTYQNALEYVKTLH